MNISTEEKEQKLIDLKEFIDNTQSELLSILGDLGWTMESLKSEREMAVCPCNSDHRMPLESVQCHLEKCALRREGYRSDDEFLPSPGKTTPSSMQMNDEFLLQVLSNTAESVAGVRPCKMPQTANRYFSDFTPHERNLLHETAVNRAREKEISQQGLEEDFQLPFQSIDKEERTKSKLELYAEMRDAKRRRANYKKVHTGRKTHTEVLRELIGNQMEHMQSTQNTAQDEHSQK